MILSTGRITDRRGNIQVGFRSRDDSSKFALVLGFDFLDGNHSGCLFVDDGTKTGFTLHNDIWDTHLAAKGGQEYDKFNGVHVVGNDDQRCLLGFDEGDNVVKTVLHKQRLLSLLWNILEDDKRLIEE